MYKACSKCGKLHSYNYKCNVNRPIRNDKGFNLRQKNKWHKKSEEIREASNYLCSVCREEGIYNYKRIEVHHIIKLEDRPEGLLDNYNLVALCVEHHKLADAGKIDKDYLFKLARDREDNR